MKRIMLTVAYDGTDYHGWQVQPGVPTIEGELNRALRALTGEEIVVTGASRTDAGVHSMGNVAVFDTSCPIPAANLPRALDGRLPEDIVVVSAVYVKPDFHPRHCDHRKTYEYRIYNDRIRDPQTDRYSYHYYGDLDVEKMKEAAAFLKGTHDFSSFCAAATDVEDKVRTIYDISVCKEGKMIKIRVTGNGFLYNMVRIISGTLLFAGNGRTLPEEVKSIIEGKDRQLAGPTLPAKGLTQIEIDYTEAGDIYENDQTVM